MAEAKKSAVEVRSCEVKLSKQVLKGRIILI